MSLLGFCKWLASTPGSAAIHEAVWAYPVFASVHVLALWLLVGMTAALDVRLLGLGMLRVRASDVARWLFPWIAAGFVLMAISGALLFYADPVRYYQNLFFRAKVILLILAGVNAWVFHRAAYRRVAQWDRDPVPPARARVAAVLSLMLWAVIIMSGRMIAYDWFDCDRQPQPPVINFLTGCVADSAVAAAG